MEGNHIGKDAAVKEILLINNSDKSKDEFSDLDQILGNGRFQLFMVWVIQTLVAFIGAINYYYLVFMVIDPPKNGWSCQDPDQIRCPKGEGNISRACGGGEIVFNTSHINFLHSLAVENLWLCDDKIKGAGVLTAFYLGQVINSLLFGQLCDTWGRKPVLHVTNLIFIIARLISFFLTDHYVVFLILTSLGTGFFPVGVRAGYTIVAEICDEKARKSAFISGWIWWVAGLSLLPFIAKYVGDWYSLGLSCTLINLIFTACYPFIPESPRWLVGQKRYQEAADIIKMMRRINKDTEIKNLPQLLEKINTQYETEENPSFFKAFRKGSIIRMAVCMAIVWSVNDYFYIAGSLNVENLAGDMFLNFSLMSLTEMPSVFVGQFLIDKWGRRWSHTTFMLLTTIALLFCTLYAAGPEHGQLVVGLTIASKVASNVGWFIMWVQCIELFPTPLRGTGMNVAVVVSTLVTMTGPYVVDLGSIDKRYPFLIFTIFGVVGVLVTSTLPETKGRPLPERLEDIDDMVGSFKFFSWRTWLEAEQKPKTELSTKLT